MSSEGRGGQYPCHTHAILLAVSATIVTTVAWPLLVLPANVFDEVYFTFWITLCFLCATVSALICICLPLFEAYVHVFDGLLSRRGLRRSSIFFRHGSSLNMLFNFMRRRDSHDVFVDMHNKADDENKCALNAEDGDSQASNCEDTDTGNNNKQQGAQTPQTCVQDALATRSKSTISQHCKDILRVSGDFDTSSGLQAQLADKDSSAALASLVYNRTNIPVSVLHRLFLWLYNYCDIRMARAHLSAWDILRWNARSMTMVLVSISSGIFSTLSAIIYLVDGINLAGLVLVLHALLVILSLGGLRFVNLYQKGLGQCSRLPTCTFTQYIHT
jgi:hypothetical protein